MNKNSLNQMLRILMLRLRLMKVTLYNGSLLKIIQSISLELEGLPSECLPCRKAIPMFM